MKTYQIIKKNQQTLIERQQKAKLINNQFDPLDFLPFYGTTWLDDMKKVFLFLNRFDIRKTHFAAYPTINHDLRFMINTRNVDNRKIFDFDKHQSQEMICFIPTHD